MRKLLLASVAIAIAATSTAASAVTYEITGGKLTAIRGIDGNPEDGAAANVPYIYSYQDQTYRLFTDIEFFDGPCTTGFQANCQIGDSFSAVARNIRGFLTPYLVDNVMVDGKEYDFLSQPSLVNGCSDPSVCNIYAGVVRDSLSNIVPMLLVTLNSGTLKFSNISNALPDTSTIANTTYARLVRTPVLQSVAAVPEPASWTMMIAGFGMIGATMRRRKTAVATSVRFA